MRKSGKSNAKVEAVSSKRDNESDEVSFPVEGYDGGSISMTSVRIG